MDDIYDESLFSEISQHGMDPTVAHEPQNPISQLIDLIHDSTNTAQNAPPPNLAVDPIVLHKKGGIKTDRFGDGAKKNGKYICIPWSLTSAGHQNIFVSPQEYFNRTNSINADNHSNTTIWTAFAPDRGFCVPRPNWSDLKPCPYCNGPQDQGRKYIQILFDTAKYWRKGKAAPFELWVAAANPGLQPSAGAAFETVHAVRLHVSDMKPQNEDEMDLNPVQESMDLQEFDVGLRATIERHSPGHFTAAEPHQYVEPPISAAPAAKRQKTSDDIPSENQPSCPLFHYPTPNQGGMTDGTDQFDAVNDQFMSVDPEASEYSLDGNPNPSQPNATHPTPTDFVPSALPRQCRQLGTFPYFDSFISRPQYSGKLQEFFAKHREKCVVVQQLRARPGSGKSSICIAFTKLASLQLDYDYVIWISLDEDTSAMQSYIRVVTHMNIHVDDASTTKEYVQATNKWLSQQILTLGKRILMVWDNTDRFKTAKDLSPFFPALPEVSSSIGCLHILITAPKMIPGQEEHIHRQYGSANAAWSDVEILPMNDIEALSLFENIHPNGIKDEAGRKSALEIAKLVNYLPVVLVGIAGFARRNETPFSVILGSIKQAGMKHIIEDHDVILENLHGRPLLTAYKLMYNSMCEYDNVAAILDVLLVLSTVDVPISIIDAVCESSDLAQMHLKRLSASCMVDIDATECRFVRMHQIPQLVMRDQLSRDKRIAACKAAFEAIGKCFNCIPSGIKSRASESFEGQWELSLQLIEHVHALWKLCQEDQSLSFIKHAPVVLATAAYKCDEICLLSNYVREWAQRAQELLESSQKDDGIAEELSRAICQAKIYWALRRQKGDNTELLSKFKKLWSIIADLHDVVDPQDVLILSDAPEIGCRLAQLILHERRTSEAYEETRHILDIGKRILDQLKNSLPAHRANDLDVWLLTMRCKAAEMENSTLSEAKNQVEAIRRIHQAAVDRDPKSKKSILLLAQIDLQLARIERKMATSTCDAVDRLKFSTLALQHAEEALSVASTVFQSGSHAIVGNCLMGIAAGWKLLGDRSEFPAVGSEEITLRQDRAIEYYDKAKIEYAKVPGVEHWCSPAYRDTARIYASRGAYDEAIEQYFSTLKNTSVGRHWDEAETELLNVVKENKPGELETIKRKVGFMKAQREKKVASNKSS